MTNWWLRAMWASNRRCTEVHQVHQVGFSVREIRKVSCLFHEIRLGSQESSTLGNWTDCRFMTFSLGSQESLTPGNWTRFRYRDLKQPQSSRGRVATMKDWLCIRGSTHFLVASAASNMSPIFSGIPTWHDRMTLKCHIVEIAGSAKFSDAQVP